MFRRGLALWGHQHWQPKQRPSAHVGVGGCCLWSHSTGLPGTIFCGGAYEWRIWGRLGWQEVKRRYRRTVLGPFWATASLGMFIGGMVFIWAPLFRVSVASYLPFLAAGMVVWTLVNSLVCEGCTVYTNGANVITQLNFPYSILNYVAIWRNIIVFFHNVLIVVVINLSCRSSSRPIPCWWFPDCFWWPPIAPGSR